MTGAWVEPDVRDDVVEYVSRMVSLTRYTVRALLLLIGIGASKFYEWKKRYGEPNHHSGHIPRKHWILPEEREAIVDYCLGRIQCGYRRLTYMMIDEDVAYVSPATTYRILKMEGLLNTWALPMKTEKGNGFVQPKKIHQDWHTDIAYVNILGTFFFLITVMEGFSRMILHHELRAHMQEYDVEMVIQRAIEKYPDAKANLISDNGPQYISRDFKEFIRESGLNHVKISVGYPQSNGKLERFHKTIKEEKIRKTAMLNEDDARKQIDEFIMYYNEERLHSGVYYLTPKEVFEGKMEMRIAERQKKLDTARERRARIAESRLSA